MEEKNKSLIGNKKGEVAVRIDSLIEARYKLTSKENDVVDIVSMQLKDDDNLRYEIDLSKYFDYYIVDKNVAKVNKKRTFVNVVSMVREKGVNVKTERGEVYYPWFSKIEYINDTGNLLVDLHPEMKEMLLSAQRGIYYDIKYTVNLTNEYAKRYYYCCKLYSSSTDNEKGWRLDRLDELQYKLEVPKSYIKRFTSFEEKVLMVAQKQINEYSDLKITYERIRKGREVTHIKTYIEKKTKEELKEVESKILNIKLSKAEKIHKNTCLRKQINDEIKPYIDIIKTGINNKYRGIEGEQTLNLKKELAERYDMTVRNLDRYIHININLIEELIDLYDKKFITLSEAEKYSKKDKTTQLKEYKKIQNNVKKYKQYLCEELVELLDEYKLSYNSAEKYSKEPLKKQLEYYKKISKKNKCIDVEYKDVDDEVSIDKYQNDDMEQLLKEIEDIKKIEQHLKQLELTGITEEVLKEIYNNSGKDVERVKYIAHKLTEQPNDIPRPLRWISAMVKPNVYEEPFKAKKRKINFTNYEQRNYDFDDLERKLLGWDNDN